MNQLTGKPIIADTSFGVTTVQDSWSDGVVGVLIYPTPGDYAARISTLAPQLESTCN